MPSSILQEGAGDHQVVTRRECAAQVDFPVICMAGSACHRWGRQNPRQIDPLLLHLLDVIKEKNSALLGPHPLQWDLPLLPFSGSHLKIPRDLGHFIQLGS